MQADNGAFLKHFVAQLATQEPSVAQVLMSRYDDLVQREKTKVINFDHHSRNVWHSINTKYASMRDSKQYDISGQVIDGIEASIESIAAKAGVERASFGTKSYGIQTLRKVGKTICMSGSDVIGHEVQRYFQHDTTLEAAMLDILRVMSAEERERLCLENDGRSSFLDKMCELDALANDCCVLEGLPEVIREMRGLPADENDGDDEQEEDYDDEVQEEDLYRLEEYTGQHEILRNEYRNDEFRSESQELEFLDAYDSCGAPIPHRIRAYERKYGRM